MNITREIHAVAESAPRKLAVWWNGEAWTYEDLSLRIAAWHKNLAARGLRRGDCLVFAAQFSHHGIAALFGALSLGATIVLIEPWLSKQAMQTVARRFGDAPVLGARSTLLWLRAKGFRGQNMAFQPLAAAAMPLPYLDVEQTQIATITFSSGSLGGAKEVRRSHAFILDQLPLLTEGGQRDQFAEPDFAVLPGVAVFNILCGRGAVLAGRTWRDERALRDIIKSTSRLGPATLSAGPAALAAVLRAGGLSSLKHVYVGGALCDLQLADELVTAFPRTQCTHIYGTSEAEPLATCDLREAAHWAREHDELQIRLLGKPFPGTLWRLEDELLFIAGPQVTTNLVSDRGPSNGEASSLNGATRWLGVDDRIVVESDLWIYAGRRDHAPGQAALEERLYRHLGHTRAFLHRVDRTYIAVGDVSQKAKAAIRGDSALAVKDVVKAKIVRDRRHEARIDRQATLRPRGAVTRWITYLNERSPLPVLALLALGPVIGGARLAESPQPAWLSGIFFGVIMASYIAARLLDEVKDVEKDRELHPTRPLPRGLLTVSEARSGGLVAILAIVATGMVTAVAGEWRSAATIMLIATLLWCIGNNFFLPRLLTGRLWTTLFSHQLLALPLYALPFTWGARSNTLADVVGGFVLLNLAGSLIFEIGRKLDPTAPRRQETYLVHRGAGQVTAVLAGCIVAALVGLHYMHAPWWLSAIYILLLLILPILKLSPRRFRVLQALATAASLMSLWALALR